MEDVVIISGVRSAIAMGPHGKVSTSCTGVTGGGVPEFVENRGRGRRSWTKGQRKRGVKTEENRSKPKKSTKILLTGKWHSHDTPIAPVSCLPPVRTFRRSSPIRTPEKSVSKEHRCRHK